MLEHAPPAHELGDIASALVNGGGDEIREDRRQRRDGPRGPGREPLRKQRFRADEDVEPFDQVRREALPRPVGDLQAGEVRRPLAQLGEYVERDGVAAARSELVDVEGERLACVGRRFEVAKQRPLVEREVRRCDHGDGVRAEIGRVRRKVDRLARRLRAAVNSDGEAIGPRGDEELRRPAALGRRQQDALTRRAEREQPVDASALEERDQRVERVLVEGVAAVGERRYGSCESASEHDTTLSSRSVSALRVEREGAVLRVTLARPERRNAFDAGLIRELTEAFADVGDARVVVLAGEGESFCAGADVDWQRSAIELTYEENVEDALRLYGMMEAIDSCPAPVVGRVQGYALGGGSGLVCCTDIALAAPGATFGFSEVKLGIVPAVVSPFVLRRIGEAAARRLFLTGERFGGETALRIGLVHELADDLDGAVDRVVAELLSSGPGATRAAKQLITSRPSGEEAARLAADLRAGPEGQEGLRAFLEKRPAAWRSESSS
jgi:methylglutaconyl-CoA hydratase